MIWATWDRLPLIKETNEPRLYASIAVKCRDHNCEPLAIGGIEDHIHLLVRMHPTISVATLAKEVKGASSHLVTHEIEPSEFFKWQGSYRAFTIRKSDVDTIRRYIENQKQHHAQNQLQGEWEPSDDQSYDSGN
jgi:REP element-mobilizing transposase RayT